MARQTDSPGHNVGPENAAVTREKAQQVDSMRKLRSWFVDRKTPAGRPPGSPWREYPKARGV